MSTQGWTLRLKDRSYDEQREAPHYRDERHSNARGRARARWASLPSWLTEADLDFYAGEFARIGFRAGPNGFRNVDRNWELLAPFAGAPVTVPALYIAGERDLVPTFRGMEQLIPSLSKFVPHLQETIIFPGCGPWTQQERAAEVNAAMIDFLRRHSAQDSLSEAEDDGNGAIAHRPTCELRPRSLRS